MTKEEIAALRLLLEKATPGTWEDHAECCDFDHAITAGSGKELIAVHLEAKDAAIAVAAVNALPAILDEIERLREFIKSWVLEGQCGEREGEAPGYCIPCGRRDGAQHRPSCVYWKVME